MKYRLTLISLMGALVVLAFGLGVHAASARSDAAKVFTDPCVIDLARAIEGGNASEIRRLVKEGADLSAQGEQRVTLVQWAILRDQPRMLTLLLELGADPLQLGLGGQTALHMAADAKKRPYLQILLDHGADPNARDGRTRAPVLSEAIMTRNTDAVALLLKHRADPNVGDRQNETPLHVAAQVNDYSSMLELLKAGADPTIRNSAGHTFMAYFAIQPRESMMSWEAKRARNAVRDWLAGHGYGEVKP